MSVETRRSPRYCLWGGGRGSVQIGSATDRRLQIQCRWIADVERLMAAMGRAVSGPMQRAADAVAEFARALSGDNVGG